MTQQEKIEQAVKAKQKRYDQTSASILVSWATNCAVAMIANTTEKIDKQKGIIEWRDWFINSYRSWMAENGPEENKKDEECEKFWSDVEQANYNERSETDIINEELQNIPF